MSTYVRCRTKIFSLLSTSRDPLSSHRNTFWYFATPWQRGPPKENFYKISVTFFWLIDFHKNSSVDRGSYSLRSVKILEKSVDCNSKKIRLNISVINFWSHLCRLMFIVELRPFRRKIGLETPYRATVTVIRIFIPPGSEGPPNNFRFPMKFDTLPTKRFFLNFTDR